VSQSSLQQRSNFLRVEKNRAGRLASAIEYGRLTKVHVDPANPGVDIPGQTPEIAKCNSQTLGEEVTKTIPAVVPTNTAVAIALLGPNEHFDCNDQQKRASKKHYIAALQAVCNLMLATLTGNALQLAQNANGDAVKAIVMLNKHHCELSSAYYQLKYDKVKAVKLDSNNPRQPLEQLTAMLETLKDAMPPIITEAMYLCLFVDILPRHLYRDLILEFQKMMDQGETCSLQEMVQKAVFYFENQVVNAIKTKQAHNIENKNLKRSQTAHNKSLNSAGVGKQTVTCKFCNKPYHTASVFQQSQIQIFQWEETDYEGKLNAKSQDKCRKCWKIGHKADVCRSGTICTTCGKGGHTAAVCMSKPCPHCGKHRIGKPRL
jgi:hypothetical protein